MVYLLFWCTIVQWTFVKLYIWSIVLFIKSLTMNTHWDLRFRAQINLDVIQNMAFISLCAPCFFPLFKQHFLSATSVNKVAKVKQLVNMLLGNWLLCNCKISQEAGFIEGFVTCFQGSYYFFLGLNSTCSSANQPMGDTR